VRRVCIGFVEIAGYYTQLAHGLHEIGIEPWLLLVRSHKFGYEPPPRQPRLIRAAARFEGAGRALRAPFLAAAFVHALFSCDAFIVAFPSTRAHLAVYRVLHLFRKRTITVFHGSDHRPPYCDAQWLRGDDPGATADTTALRRTLVRAAERTGAVVGNPFSATFHSKPFVSFQRIGVPAVVVDAVPPRTDGPIVLLHAPSNPLVKGTAAIRSAVKSVQDAGIDVEYVEVEGVPHAELIARMAGADLVVDQTYSDTPFTGIGVDAATLGRPVLVGSFAHDQFEAVLGSEAAPPAFLCAPDEIGAALTGLVENRKVLDARGSAARTFLDQQWRRDVVARRLVDVLTGAAPDEWYVDPSACEYLWGCGLSKQEVVRRVRVVVDGRGTAGLALSDQPRIEAAYIKALEELDA
jgi:hypothetical protein